jgi:hypothetical protein
MEQIALRDFRGDEFLHMTIEDRIRQCRALAEDAAYQARLADRDMRLEYAALAQHWSDLADELLTRTHHRD